MDINQITLITTTIIGGVATVVGTVTSVLTKIKLTGYKNYKKLYKKMLALVVEAEHQYDSMKNFGMSVSAFKKSYVMTNLESYARNQGIAFDNEVWNDELENTIQLTNQVNVNDTKSNTENNASVKTRTDI